MLQGKPKGNEDMHQGLEEIFNQFENWEDSNSSQPPFDWSKLSLGDRVSKLNIIVKFISNKFKLDIGGRYSNIFRTCDCGKPYKLKCIDIFLLMSCSHGASMTPISGHY